MPYTCKICGQTFKGTSSAGAFTQHVMREHPVAFREYSNRASNGGCRLPKPYDYFSR